MNLATTASAYKPGMEYSARKSSAPEPATIAARYILTRFNVSASLAYTIADLAKLGGAK